jgi:hypothetical protein
MLSPIFSMAVNQLPADSPEAEPAGVSSALRHSMANKAGSGLFVYPSIQSGMSSDVLRVESITSQITWLPRGYQSKLKGEVRSNNASNYFHL